MIAESLTAHKPIPSVEVLIQKQMLRATLGTLCNDPKEKAPVEFGGARDNLATPFVGRPRVLHFERIAPTGTSDMPDVLILFRLRRFRRCTSYKVLRTWNHRYAFQYERINKRPASTHCTPLRREHATRSLGSRVGPCCLFITALYARCFDHCRLTKLGEAVPGLLAWRCVPAYAGRNCEPNFHGKHAHRSLCRCPGCLRTRRLADRGCTAGRDSRTAGSDCQAAGQKIAWLPRRQFVGGVGPTIARRLCRKRNCGPTRVAGRRHPSDQADANAPRQDRGRCPLVGCIRQRCEDVARLGHAPTDRRDQDDEKGLVPALGDDGWRR